MTPPQSSRPQPLLARAPQTATQAPRFVRRKQQQSHQNQDAVGIVSILVLALIGLVALVTRRLEYDPWIAVSTEVGIGGLLAASLLAARKTSRAPLVIPALCSFLLLMPWIVNLFSRQFGNGNDVEILLLASLAWGGIALAVSSKTSRSRSLSVVCSGFLTLFTAFTADSPEITLVVYLWMAVCLWWLVCKHWAGVSTLHAATVQSSLLPRVLTHLAGYSVFAFAILLISDSVPVLRKLRAEIAPTSGGTSQKDKSARAGVGNGDALVAAKNHATSFGPVETDFFLDSEKPSLFDVFSDEFGEPIRKKKVERAQALSPNEVRTNDGKFSEANRNSGSDFAIERDVPLPPQTLEDLASDALMFFEGRTGIRLAVQRFDCFEDNRWTQSKPLDKIALRKLQPLTVDIDEELWFAPPGKRIQGTLSPFVSSIPEALRFTRYGDNSIPAASGLQLWRIDALTQSDFFAYTGDSSLLMPGREAVPDYTVVRFVDSQLDAKKLHEHMRTCAPGSPHLKPASKCRSQIAKLAHQYADHHERGWQQVQAIVDGIRRDFAVDNVRSETASRAQGNPSKAPKSNASVSQDVVDQFLRDRRGPSYLFATTAALMLDHFGYDTRLVTGFYVNPRHYVAAERATAILPEDAHAWIEINSGHGYWVPLEPTPGFAAPPIRSTWMFWLAQNWQRFVYATAIALIVAAVLYSLRGWVFNLFLIASTPLIHYLPQRQRMASLHKILDVRWTLIGSPRASNLTQRRTFLNQNWGLSHSQKKSATQFFDLYEAQRFGTVENGTVQGTVEDGTVEDGTELGPVLRAMPSIIRSIKLIKNPSQK